MKKILVLFLALCPFSVNAQVSEQWAARYSGTANLDDEAVSVAVDIQGNVYVTGYSEGTGTDYDYLTIKYNSEGVKLWDARYNGPANGEDYPRSLAIDNQGNVYVTGWSYGIGTGSDYATIKYNPEGVEQWVARYGLTGESRGDEAESITVDKQGNIYVTGTGRNSSGNYYVTIKYNTEGDEMWVRMHNEPDWSSAYSIKTDEAGNAYVTGISTVISPVVNQDILTIKYSSDGAELWVTRFDGPAHSAESVNNSGSLTVDNQGNAYVAATTTYSVASHGFATIKYNSSGNQEWVQYYINGTANSVAVDSSGNVIVTGSSSGTGSGYDFATVKYNSAGVQQWVSSFNGSGNDSDIPYSILTDKKGNVYVTGASNNGNNSDYVTVKYNPEGAEAWVAIYNGTSNGEDYANTSTIDDSSNIYVTGYSVGSGGSTDYATIKYSQTSTFSITKPIAGSKLIAGQKDTIRWNGGEGGQVLKIEYSLDQGSTYIPIVLGIQANSGYYIWDTPNDILATKAKIRITDMANSSNSVESYLFRIKPYILTRLDQNSDYYDYRKERDQWGFSNIEEDVWPETWYSQFNYQGIDQFTGEQYPQALLGGLFSQLKSFVHPDWISWVDAFTFDACYLNSDPEGYSMAALIRWKSILSKWNGSCFGIAAANALVFSHKDQFQTVFAEFPATSAPIEVTSDNGVKSVVNELFNHQFGNLSRNNNLEGIKKNPTQTLYELKQMLLDDDCSIKTLTIFNNNGTGAHTILAYGIEQDPVQNNLYYVKIYDNLRPYSPFPIIIDISANGGKGSWSTVDYPEWGGDKGIYLEVISDNYFNNAAKGNGSKDNYESPFILPDDRVEIINNPTSDIQIRSFNTDKVTGYYNNTLSNEIPNAIPLMIKNGSEIPPYGFSLPDPGYDFYIIDLNNFQSDTINTFFFTGNRSYWYQRTGAIPTQTDQLYFYSGVTVYNPEEENKSFSLLSLINETTREKLCIIRSLSLTSGSYDRVKIENPDSNKIRLTSYSAEQHYDIELNYLTSDGVAKFECYNITLPGNSCHIIDPDWENLANSKLMVLVDLGNDDNINDTLYLNNVLTGIGKEEDYYPLHGGLYLSQNYPNPFNTTSTITYQLPFSCKAVMKIYDPLGNDVATIVNENKPAGNYQVVFNASSLSPGMYFYRLQAGSYSITKKFILCR